MKIEEEIRKIIMKTILLDHAENERKLRCYEDIKDSDIERCINNIEYQFGILLGKDPTDFTTVNDVIKAVKLELQD